MPVDRTQDRFGGRFSRDADSSGVLEGYRRAVQRQDSKMVRRNIEPYARYGFEQRLSELRTMTDAERFAAASRAVVAKYRATKGKGGSSSGGGRGGGSKSPATRAPAKDKPARKAAPTPKPKATQHLPPRGAARPVQHKPPKGAAQPKPRLPTLPPRPVAKRPPVIKPAGKAPVRA